MWSSGTAAVQAIWCHDITEAWVRIPARQEQKICESKFTDVTLLGWCLDELYIHYVHSHVSPSLMAIRWIHLL